MAAVAIASRLTALSKPLRFLLPFALLPALAACDMVDLQSRYACTGKGYVHRYRGGKELVAPAADRIAFSLATDRYGDGYDIGPDAPLPEHRSKAVRLDRARSNDSESLYSYDVTDQGTRQRTVTTLVLNRLSGDFRAFHHRWVLPADWKDSDQYFFSGSCVKGAA
ncbi:MAG: hypothetical protein JWQ33_1881 [Ramlibacter sp.]|nr:hypothetical protein [Ramlibacter sp.]